jgi:vacuolar-type H+-ATPase subunit H
MKRIREAEAEAEQIGHRAEAERRKLVAEAHEAAERRFDEMKAAAREEERRLVEEAKRTAGIEAEKLAAESRAQVESVSALGEERVEAGIGKVLEAVAAEE